MGNFYLIPKHFRSVLWYCSVRKSKMPEVIDLLLVLLVGLTGGFFDSTVGSGGLITIPSLIFIGLPPQVAIATDRLGTVGQELTALFKFSKAQKILWKYVPAFTVCSLMELTLALIFY